MAMEKKRRMEILALAAVVVIAGLLIGFKMHASGVVAKEDALIDQLRTVRGAVALYLTVNKVNPPDLKALTTQKYTIGNKRGLYLTGVMVDEENYPVDAFKMRFSYDPKDGRVWASGEKYAAW